MNKNKSYQKSVWWIKRDFRLYDNRALTKAMNNSKQLLPIFAFEPGLLNHEQTSSFHIQAQLQALKHLKSKLKNTGSDILVTQGEFPDILTEIKSRFNFEAIFSYQEIGTNITYKRDQRVEKWCDENNIDWHQPPRNGVVRGSYDRDNRMDFWNKQIKQRNQLPVPSSDQLELSQEIKQNPLPTLNQLGFTKKKQMQTVTEQSAKDTLEDFLYDRGKCYFGGISSMNTATECCSRLSVHLAWGTISLRTAFQQLQDRIEELDESETPDSGEWKRSLSMFKSRLYWHDHFIQRLEDEPEIEFEPINRAFSKDKISYKRNLEVLDHWYQGYTGFPMIDASMRCFHTTGYLNFRMRAMVTSFACHILHLPWRDIMYPMARLMADYIPGIHISQLQMQAGITGINSIRVYNPKKQIKDQDPECKFIKKWIPELRGYTPAEILSYDEGGLLNLKGYPDPIVDYDERRSEMLSDLYKIKKSDEGQREASRVLKKHGSRKNS